MNIIINRVSSPVQILESLSLLHVGVEWEGFQLKNFQ